MAKHKILGTVLSASMLLTLALVPGTAAAVENAAQPAATGATYYVDCSATDNGTGTENSPLNSITAANGVTLNAGDQLLFKRGVTCKSQSQTIDGQANVKAGLRVVNAKGTENAPIVIGAYGEESATPPLIAGEGVSETILLKNSEYVTVTNLEVTNTDANKNDYYKYMRRGIIAMNDNAGALHGITIANNNIHDIYGERQKDLGGSGAIQLENYGGSIPVVGSQVTKGSVKRDNSRTARSYFDGVAITGNTITDVNRSGINMSSDFRCREDVAWECGVSGATRDSYPWTPNKNLYIAGNTLKNIGGDGIVVQMSDGAVVEKNYLENAASVTGQGSNAGIWNWNSDNTLFQYNEVTNTQKTSGNNDGTAWDFDYGTRNTVFQYNYSHDNAGGALLVCACTDWYNNDQSIGTALGGTFRYNLSVNDGVASKPCEGSNNTNRTVTLDGITDLNFYNNTVVLPKNENVEFSQDAQNGGVTYNNNVIIAQGGSIADANDKLNADGFQISYGNNLYVGAEDTKDHWGEVNANGNMHVGLDGFLTATGIDLDAVGKGDLSSLYSDKATAYTAGKGRAMASDGFPFAISNTHLTDESLVARDFPHGFDHAKQQYGEQIEVSGWQAPAVGAFQGTTTTATGAAGDLAAGKSESIDAPGNATIEVTATTTGDAQLGVSVDNAKGYVQKTSGAAGEHTLVVRTSSDASKLKFENLGKSGTVTDITARTMHDELWDGSFESKSNGNHSQKKNGISPWAPANRDHSKNRDNYGASRTNRYRSEVSQENAVVTGELAAKLGKMDGVSFVQIDQRNIPATPGATYRLGFWMTTGASNDGTPSTVSATVRSRKEGSGAGGSFGQYATVLLNKSVDAPSAKGGDKVYFSGTFTVPWDVPADSALWVNIAQPDLADDSNAYVDNVTLTETDAPSTDIASIAVTKQPTTTEYQTGDALDATGLEVTATLDDGSTRVLDPSEYTLLGFDSSKAGIVPVTVKLNVDGSKTAKFRVTVRNVVNLANKFCSSAAASDVQTKWGTSSAKNTCDGDLSTNWSNWKDSDEGAPANPSWLNWTFDRKYELGSLEFYLDQTKAEAAPSQFVVQYLDEADKGWVTTELVGKPDASKPVEPAVIDLSSLPATKAISLQITPANYGSDHPYSKVAEVKIFQKADSVPALDGIEIAAQPTRTEYTVGDLFSADGLKINGLWGDAADELTAAEYQLTATQNGSTIDLAQPFTAAGDVTVTVTSTADSSLTTSFTLKVAAKAPEPGPDPTPTVDKIDSSTPGNETLEQPVAVAGEVEFAEPAAVKGYKDRSITVRPKYGKAWLASVHYQADKDAPEGADPFTVRYEMSDSRVIDVTYTPVVGKASHTAVYRLFNPNETRGGSHVYTTSMDEYNYLVSVGWRGEGKAFAVLADGRSGSKDGTAVHRLYNKNDGSHLLSLAKAEVDYLVGLGWKDEGIAFYVSDDAPVDALRGYNPNSGEHLFTVLDAEMDVMVKAGWNNEGVGFKVWVN